MTMRAAERETVFIAVACTENPMRQRSTLAPELGHVLFDDIGVPVEAQIESRAAAFARHLLLPLKGLSEVVETMCGTSGVEDLLSRVSLVRPSNCSPGLSPATWTASSACSSWRRCAPSPLPRSIGEAANLVAGHPAWIQFDECEPVMRCRVSAREDFVVGGVSPVPLNHHSGGGGFRDGFV